MRLADTAVVLVLWLLPSACSFSASHAVSGDPSLASSSALVAEGKALYTANCAVCHGPLETSAKLGRTEATIRAALNSIPQMASLQILSEPQVMAIAAALSPRAPAATGGANPFICTSNSADPGPSDVRRLTRQEYLSTLQLLVSGYVDFSALTSLTDTLPADAVANVFNVDDSSISPDHVQAYLDIADQVAGTLVSQPAWLQTVLACPYTTQGMSDTCWANFFNGFATQALRRPPYASEQADFKNLYATLAGGSVSAGLQGVVSALLQSPGFLYKVELDGKGHAGRTDLLDLTDFELASRLSFLALGHGPDATLIADVKAGHLQTQAGYSSIVQRLFADPAARDRVNDFYAQWLGANHLPAVGHPDWFLNGTPRAPIQPEALKELRDFTTDLVWNKPGTYKDFMSSEQSYVAGPALSSIYGTALVSGGMTSNPLVLPATGMTASVGQAEGGVWNLYSNGTLQQSVQLSAGVPTTVTVRAHASLAAGSGAAMVLSYNGQSIGSTTVSATSDMDYTYTFTPATATGIFTIAFTNDYFDPTTQMDRNLYVNQTTLIASPSSATGLSPGLAPSLPPGQRPGILSRVVMLLSGTTHTSLVHRGLIVRRNLLCDRISQPVISPSEAALFTPPQPDPTASLRQQIETRTSPARCMACHSQLNPFGYVLQNYDALGRYQTQEKVFDANGGLLATHPIDATALPNIDSANEPQVNGLGEMTTAIAKSTKGPSCASQQWFTYTTGRDPTGDDSCALHRLFQALMDGGTVSASGDTPGTFLNMFKASVYDPGFRQHKVGPQN